MCLHSNVTNFLPPPDTPQALRPAHAAGSLSQSWQAGPPTPLPAATPTYLPVVPALDGAISPAVPLPQALASSHGGDPRSMVAVESTWSAAMVLMHDIDPEKVRWALCPIVGSHQIHAVAFLTACLDWNLVCCLVLWVFMEGRVSHNAHSTLMMVWAEIAAARATVCGGHEAPVLRADGCRCRAHESCCAASLFCISF